MIEPADTAVSTPVVASKPAQITKATWLPSRAILIHSSLDYLNKSSSKTTVA